MTAKGTGNQTSKAQGESEYPSTRAPRESVACKDPGSARQPPFRSQVVHEGETHVILRINELFSGDTVLSSDSLTLSGVTSTSRDSGSSQEVFYNLPDGHAGLISDPPGTSVVPEP